MQFLRLPQGYVKIIASVGWIGRRYIILDHTGYPTAGNEPYFTPLGRRLIAAGRKHAEKGT